LRVSELRNRAATEASGSLLAFVDADHEIGPRWIASALDTLSDPIVGAVGALYTAPAVSWVQRSYGALRGRTIGRTDVAWLGSGNLVVRRETFEAVGGFDASLEACEDVDFCQRVRAAGWRLIGDERLYSLHLGDPSTLAALFRAERWRGRDNLRVTLRGTVTARDLPSVLIPLVQIAAGLVVLGAVAAVPFLGTRVLLVALLAAVALVLPSALRAARMAAVAGWRRPMEVAQAAIVALTYDVARACALLIRASHHRQSAASARSR